ncbi:MAG: baseplate J/gp47 family protein [Actinomycetota bacterium]
MNPETVTLIERPYQEIVDDILIAIVGGVVNEPIFFDLKEDLYPLSQPAADVRSITGTRDKSHHTFQKEVDFLFSEGDNAVVWQPGGAQPDDETIFYVDYFRPESQSRSPLSDSNVGSVTRILGEAIGREIATVYQQVNQAYLSGFIDTAEGQALELVVAILGVKRKTKEFAVGLLTFFRDSATGDGNITLPEGVVSSTAKDEATFVTTDLRTLQRGQARIDVPIRAGDAFKGEAGIVKSGAITKLSQPITGIARVTNFEATVLGAEGETDEQLRARAKARLRGLGKATLAALANAILEGRGTLVEARDPNSAPGKRSKPGIVTLLVEADERERFPSLTAAVHETRAAGIYGELVARYVFVKLHLVASPARALTGDGKLKLINEIIDEMQNYVNGLSGGDPATGEGFLKAIKKVKDVIQDGPEKPTIIDVIARQSDFDQSRTATLVDALISKITTTSTSDTGALRAALTGVLDEIAPAPPTAKQKPNRDLVKSSTKGSAEQRATDTEIEAGTFMVVPPDEKWFVVLDTEPADIVLKEKA